MNLIKILKTQVRNERDPHEIRRFQQGGTIFRQGS